MNQLRKSNLLLVPVLAIALLATLLTMGPTAFADDNPATEDLLMSCTVATSLTPDTVVEAGLQGVVAGEEVTFTNAVTLEAGDVYQDILQRPDGSVYYASRIELVVLPSGLTIDSLSPEFTIDGVPVTVISAAAPATPDPTMFTLETETTAAGTTYTLLFPGDEAAMLADQSGSGVLSYQILNPTEVFALTFDAIIPAGTARSTIFDGSECFASVSTGPSNRDTNRPRTALVVVEPQVLISKTTALDNAYPAGSLVEFEITAAVPLIDPVDQQLAVAAAQDVILVDTPNPGLIPVDAAGIAVVDGGTTAGNGIWSAADGTITYEVGTIEPGNQVDITEQFRIAVTNPAASVLDNEVCGDFTALGPTDPNRVDAGCDIAEVIVSSESPAITKRAIRIPDEADLERFGAGLPFWYEITVVLPPSSSYENFTILDSLPDGVQFNSYVSESCSGTNCPPAFTQLGPTVFPGGNGTGIGWYPNSIPFDAAARTITLRYEAELLASYAGGDPVLFFDEFVNNASINWNTVDRLGAVPPVTASPPPFDGEVTTTDTIIYDRPVLNVDKTVVTDGNTTDTTRDSWDYEIGDLAEYSIVISNSGSSDAVNISYDDAPIGIDIDISSVEIDGVACNAACVLVGNDLQTVIPGPLAPGASVTVTYNAVPNKNGDLDNTVELPVYEDSFSTPYTETPTDTVSLVIPDPVLTLTKTEVTTVAQTANTVGTRFPFTFTVTNVSSTTAYTPIVTDTPPTGLCNYDGGLDASPDVNETAAGVWEINAPIAPGDSVTFTAQVEVCGDVDPGSYVNDANLTWTDLVDGVNEAGDPYTTDDDAPLELVGPSFEVTKGPAVDGGATLKWSADLDDPEDGLQADELNGGVWTITVTNTGTAPIGGLNVVDPMPDPFEYLPGDATVVWLNPSTPDTFTDNSAPTGAEVWPGYTSELDFVIGQLQPGQEIRIAVPFIHNGEDPSDGKLTRLNTVEVRNDNLDFDPVLHTSQGEYTLIPVETGPSVSKTVSLQSNNPGIGAETQLGAPGDFFDFAIEVTLPTKATTSLHDVWIQDIMPDGLVPVNLPAAGVVPNSPTTGWTVTCTANCGTGASGGGAFIGTQTDPSGKTELAWWFDEVAPDALELDIVYVITFRAQVEQTFQDGTEIIDGFDEPLVNVAKPIFNRDAGLPGGTGDSVTTIPTAVPDVDDYERVYPLDPADVDIVTPRLDMSKTVTNANGDVVEEVTAGQTFTYVIEANNGGSGPAFDIVLNDTLGTPAQFTGPNFMTLDPTSIVATPAGTTCSVYNPSPGDPVEHLRCEFAGPLGPNQSIVVTYDGTTVPAPEFFAQTSTNNFDPMIIRNQASAPEYFESANQGGNSYSTGEAVTRIFAYTPVPEIDATCVGGAEVLPNAPVGSTVQFYAVFGNGDRIDVNGNPDGDQTMTPFPTEDLDGDGFPDAGVGFNPEVRITLQDKFTYVGTTATGPGAGDPTYSTYSAFPAPDQIVDEEIPGTYTLVWNTSLVDIPHSPNHSNQGSYLPHNGGTPPTNGDFLPHYALLIDVVKTEAGGGSVWFELSLEDAAGNTDRGTAVGEPFSFTEKDRHGCPGGPPPRVWKFPDDNDGVTLAPGQTEEFVMYIQQPSEDPVPSVFTDLLPNGLTYRGDLPVGDPNYAVATMDVVPPEWGVGATLQDFFVSSTTSGAGDTTLIWEPPPIPTGLFNDPDANGADTRWIIRVPVIANDVPAFPNEFVVNNFQWNADGSIRKDSGAMLTESAGKPSIDKRVDRSAGLYGGIFTYTVDITIPGGYAGTDVLIYDEINAARNWDAAPYLLQEGATNWNTAAFVFPATVTASLPPAVPSPEIRYANWLYTPAEFELSDYVSQTCLSGCSGPDSIDLVPLPPATLDETLTLPVSSAHPYQLEGNGAIGWYLGDIAAHTGGQDRVVRLVYEVEAPTLLEQRQRVFEQQPSNFPGGATDPGFDIRDSYWFEELSQVVHPNVVEFRQFPGDNAQLGTWEGAGDDEWETGSNAWVGEVGRSTPLATADESVTVSYPIIDMDKECGAIGITDLTDATNPAVTPAGTPNVECEIIVTNRSPVEGFNVQVTDTPLQDCALAAVLYNGEVTYIGNVNSSNPWYTDRSAPGTGFRDPADPGVVSYPCEVQSLLPIPTVGGVTDTAGDFPLTWDLTIGPDTSETLTYQFYLDGWSQQPYVSRFINNGSWDVQGHWVNRAVLGQWAAEPGGPLIGEEVVVQDQVGFEDSYLIANKFPYPRNRDVCADSEPFIQWNEAPTAAATNLWPWRHHPAGDQYNPANAAHVAGFGNPLNSDYWTAGVDNCADPLQPPARNVIAYSHPGVLRHIPLGGYGFSTAAGWASYGDAYNLLGTNDGWTKRPLSDPNNWSPQYNVTPTVPYRWAIDLRVDGLRFLSDIDILDTLPYGWEFVPGSATIVDGVWQLGAFDPALTTGYGEIPIPDPARGNIGGGACHADNNFHSGGETLTWNFERSGGADGDAPWLYQYLNSMERKAYRSAVWEGYEAGSTGFADKASWIRIHFDALPTEAVFDCDPDPTSSDRFMMENNLQVDAVRDNPIAGQGITLSDSFDMLVPVANPVTFEKLPDDDFVPDETTAFFTIEFTNDLPDPVLDLLIIDDLTASMPPLAGGGYQCQTATATLNGNPLTLNETACTGQLTDNTHLEWLIPQIASGETLIITIPIIVPKGETNGLVWDNTASTEVKEFFDSPFEDQGRITVLNPSPAPTPQKSATPNPATVNDVVTYEVSWTANPQQVFMDLAYIDTVPDGLTFVSFEGVTCSGGCPNSFTPANVVELPQVVNADGTTTLMWWFGDMPGSNQAHTWTMTYTVRVDDAYNNGTLVLDEDVITNSVTGYASEINRLEEPTSVLDPTAWSDSMHPPSDPGEADLDIEEPELEIRKSAAPSTTPADGSSQIVFTVEIENIGGMDAHNVTISDTPNDALEDIVMDPATTAGTFVTQGWTPLVPEVSWFITSIAQGDTISFTYTAEVVDTFLADGIWFAENDAAVESFTGRPGAEPEPGDRSYTGDETSVQVALVAPQLNIEKTIDGCTDDFAFASLNTPVTWCLTISNAGAAVAYNVNVSDVLPYRWSYEANSTTGTGWTQTEPTVAIVNGVEQLEWTIGDLAAGDVAVIEFQATPQQGATEVVTNWAAAEMTDANGESLPPSVTVASDRDPASASLGQYGLEIAKVPDDQQWPFIPAGGTFTWDLEISNPSDTTTNTNLVVVDYLPAPLLYSNSTSSDPRVTFVSAGAPGAGPGGTTEVTWNISDLGPLETVTIEIEAAATGGETPNQWYVNDVQVTSTEIVDEVVNQAKVWFYEPAELGDRVWRDTDVDGIQDAGEPGVNGVIVALLDGNGDPVYRDPTTGLFFTAAAWAALSPAEQAAAPAIMTTTANDPVTGLPGWYLFDNLIAGSYQVMFDPTPTGLYLTLDEQGADDAADSDANRFVGTSHVVTLMPGDSDLTIDAGLITAEEYDDTIASIDVEKFTEGVQADTPTGPALVPGAPVTWTYEVTNTGWTSLADVTVTDAPEGVVNCDVDGDGVWDDTNVIDILAPGVTRTCFIQGTVGITAGGDGTGLYTNTASATGDPVTPDFDTCGCDPDDPATWPIDPASNAPYNGTDGNPLPAVDDTDPSHYYSAGPALDIEKSTNTVDADEPNGPSVVEGGAVTWLYVVTNTGNTALTDVLVTDDQGEIPACDLDANGTFEGTSTIPLMNPGDEITCQATGTAVAGPYTNEASVTGNPVLPDPETCGCDVENPASWPDTPADFDDADVADPVADDRSHYFGIVPSIDIEKSTNGVDADDPTGPAIFVDGDVTWTYVVTNTGDTALFDAVVTDDQNVAIACDVDGNGSFESGDTIPFLLPDASVTCQGTGTATPGQYTNLAEVTGMPALPDPELCDCDAGEIGDWPDDAGMFYLAVDGNGDPVDEVEADDPSHYYGAAPSIDVEKSTNTVDADLTPGPALTPGDPVVWFYEVENTGNTALDGVSIVDSEGVEVLCDLDNDDVFESDSTIGFLLPGASVNCQATGLAVAGQYENTATVNGAPALPNPETCECDPFEPSTWLDDPTLFDSAVDSNGTPLPLVDDADPSHYYGATPGIDIEKSTNGVDADVSPGPAINPGDTVTWTYEVENTGNTALADVTVTDSEGVAVSCDVDGNDTFESGNVIAVMNPGDTVTCQATGVAINGQYMNDSDVAGTPVLPDPELCDCDPFDPDSWPDDPALFDPAVDEDGEELPAEMADDPSHYYGADPSINVEKSTVNYQADRVSGPGIAVGDPVTWTYLVINDGNTALDNVFIRDSDNVTISCDLDGDGSFESGATIGLLLPGASVNCQATGTSIAGQYENIVDVTGDPVLPDPATCNCDPFRPETWPQDPSVFTTAVDEDGVEVPDVVDEDPSHYYGTTGGVDLEKSTNTVDADQSPGPAIEPGADVTWLYVVTNTSNFALTDLEVTDFEGVTVTCPGSNDETIALLLPGRTITCEGTGTAIDGQYSNSSLVTGQPSLPNEDLCGCVAADPDTWPEGPPSIFDPIIDANTNEPQVPADDVDLSHYYGATPSIDIEKSTNGVDADAVTGPAIPVGDEVVWTYVVVNDGNTALANVTVVDSDGVEILCDVDGDVDGVFEATNEIGHLNPGDSVTCQATGTSVGGQYENIVDVTGDPVLPDPLNCNCDPFNPDTWPDDSSLFDPALDEDGNELPEEMAEDPSHYFGSAPGIELEKSTNGVDADAFPGPAIAVGEAVTWTYAVTNTGNTALLDIEVVDDQEVDIVCETADDPANVIPLLLPGASVNCEATGVAIDGQYENNADATGTPVLPNPETCECDLFSPEDWPTDPTLFEQPLDEDDTELPDVDDSDPSHYFGSDPSVSVEKSTNGVDADVSPGPAIAVGDEVVWTYVVVNDGNTALANVTVVDSDGVEILCDVDGDVDGVFEATNEIGHLNPGDSVTCQATGTSVGGQYENIVEVTGDPVLPNPEACGCNPFDPDTWPDDSSLFDPAVDEDGNELPEEMAEDPSHYFGSAPGIELEKSTNGVDADAFPGPAIAVGEAVTWTYAITNTGNTALAAIEVVDDQEVAIVCDTADDPSNVIPLLLPGASVNCEATGVAIDGQYENNADATGSPVLPDPEACDCNPFLPETWPTDPTLFSPAVDEDGSELPDETDGDPSHYYGSDPSVNVEKSTNGQQSDIEPGQGIPIGDEVIWTYLVINDGNTALANVTVVDSDGVEILCDVDGDVDGVFEATNEIGHLNPGDSVTCQATGTSVGGQYENIVEVTGDPVLPNPEACGCNPFDPDSWPDDSSLFDPAVDEDGNELPQESDDDPSHYYGTTGGVDIEKATNTVDADVAPGPALVPGGAVTWTYEVTNTSNSALANLVVSDNQGVNVDCGDGTNVIALLGVGMSQECTGTGSAATGQYVNAATVVGDPVLPDPACDCDLTNPSTWPDDPRLYKPVIDVETGEPVGPVDDVDLSHHFGAEPGLDVEKSTNGVDADETPGPSVTPGSPITWTYVVANTGNTALADIVVLDSQGVEVDCGDGSNEIALLTPGTSQTCIGEGNAVPGQYSNTADVSGTPLLPDPETCGCDPFSPETWPTDPSLYVLAVDDSGNPLPDPSDSDDSHYVATDGGLDLEKSTQSIDADEDFGPLMAVGAEVIWTYQVTNESNIAMLDVTVGDDQGVVVECPGGGPVIALMLPGEVVECFGTGTASEGYYRNVGTVEGNSAAPDPALCDCDPADASSWPADPAAYVALATSDGTLVASATDADPSNMWGGTASLDLEKATNGADSDTEAGAGGWEAGSVAKFTYVVTNSGNTAVIDIAVTDDQGVEVDCGAGTATIAMLLPGDSVTCTGSKVVTAGSYMNLGGVTGEPRLPNPALCDCDLDEPSTWPTNPALFLTPPDPETGEPYGTIGDEDPSHHFGFNPVSSGGVDPGTGGTIGVNPSAPAPDPISVPEPPDQPTGPLAYTGSNTRQLVWLALAAIAAGTFLVLGTRRRREADDSGVNTDHGGAS